MESPACILVTDDEAEIRAMLQMVLEKAGFRVLLAENGPQALNQVRESSPDLVLLDFCMPGMDGLETCTRIRQVSDVPVIFLTVQNTEDDLVNGFNAGAVDYILKPFRPRELVARIQSVLQRASRLNALPPATMRPPAAHAGAPILVYADLELDARMREVRQNGVPLAVTAMGFHLLEYFMQHTGEVVSKTDLLRDVWACADPAGSENMVEAAIKRLRKDLLDDSRQPRYIKTVWGVGYRFGE